MNSSTVNISFKKDLLEQIYLDTAYLRKVQNQYLKKRVEQWHGLQK